MSCSRAPNRQVFIPWITPDRKVEKPLGFERYAAFPFQQLKTFSRTVDFEAFRPDLDKAPGKWEICC